MKLSDEEARLVLEHRKKAKLAKVGPFQPTKADQINPVVKCEKFDLLHAHALSIYNGIIENEYQDEDDKNYVYEAVMELLGKDVWKTINAVL